MQIYILIQSFFGSIIPMVYFFIQHKVHRIPGGKWDLCTHYSTCSSHVIFVLQAYTRYAFFEWGLIFTDIGFDSVTTLDFLQSNLQVGILLAPIRLFLTVVDRSQSRCQGRNKPFPCIIRNLLNIVYSISDVLPKQKRCDPKCYSRCEHESIRKVAYCRGKNHA